MNCTLAFRESCAVFGLIVAHIWVLRARHPKLCVAILGLMLLSHLLRRERPGYFDRVPEATAPQCATACSKYPRVNGGGREHLDASLNFERAYNNRPPSVEIEETLRHRLGLPEPIDGVKSTCEKRQESPSDRAFQIIASSGAMLLMVERPVLMA